MKQKLERKDSIK